MTTTVKRLQLYVAQFGGPWIDKYVPKADADPSRLIGQPLGR